VAVSSGGRIFHMADENVRVWFDRWQLQPGDHLLARLNE